MQDGNFKSEHLAQKFPEDDVALTDGTGIMTSSEQYKRHLLTGVETKMVSPVEYRAALIQFQLAYYPNSLPSATSIRPRKMAKQQGRIVIPQE